MPSASSSIALVAVACLSIQASAQSLKVTKSGLLGTGCRPGTAEVSVARNVVSIEAQNFVATAGPGIPYSSGRRNCQATLNVEIPDGYQFAFDETKLPAQVKAEKGTQLTFVSSYYFQGSQTRDQDIATVPAGASGSVTLVNSYEPTAWSSCGGSAIVNVNTALRASNSANRRAAGSIKLNGNLDSKVVWRKC